MTTVLGGELPTNRKWVITPVISGLTLLIPFITGVITHLLSGMCHQVYIYMASPNLMLQNTIFLAIRW